MFIYNGKEYDNVWFTSDEHYGSGRHITLSCRLGFEDYEKEKRINEYEHELAKTNLSEGIRKSMISLMKHSIYGSTINIVDPIDKMNEMLIQKHNERVGANDIVFHVGDFGDFEYAKYLNGHHILILGNYEAKDLKDNYNNSFEEFRNKIIEKYNFIDVLSDYMLELDDNNKNNVKFGSLLSQEVGEIFITHIPSTCYYIKDDENQAKPYQRVNGKLIMNIFGHIHEKAKVKRFGLNVGIDAHHFYPVALDEVDFYLYAILHYYDNEVFM